MELNFGVPYKIFAPLNFSQRYKLSIAWSGEELFIVYVSNKKHIPNYMHNFLVNYWYDTTISTDSSVELQTDSIHRINLIKN